MTNVWYIWHNAHFGWYICLWHVSRNKRCSKVAFVSVLEDVCKNVAHIECKMYDPIFGMCQPYLFSYVCQMSTMFLVAWLMPVTSNISYRCAYMPS